jgi:hypothetical protein
MINTAPPAGVAFRRADRRRHVAMLKSIDFSLNRYFASNSV